MGMDLIPVYAGQEPSSDPQEVTLDAAEINAIGVRTALARMSEVAQRIETVGFIGFDEHLTSHVHTRVDGWIEVLSVRAVGDTVQEGDALFELFSPEFAIASFDVVRALESGSGMSLESARNKLRSHGASETQIAEIETTRTPANRIVVEAPRDGIVVELQAAEGMFLQPGTQAVSITDLSHVWLIVDVFERDISRLSSEMSAIARFEHLPGRSFEGEIDYIYPELDARTRTLPVRLRFDNTEGLLRPGMFGSVSLIQNESRSRLTVPSEAVIRTGAAERVVLKTGEGTFRPRLVTAGLRDSFDEGGRTEILQGLRPGEEVVASAQFLIDSESALSAGFIRMAPTREEPARGKGLLLELNRESRIATIQHGAFESLDWPAMTSEFPVHADVTLDRLTAGEDVAFLVARGADGLLGLMELGPDDGVDATGTGVALAVTPDGKLTLDHGPIPELGWPPMTMDLPVEGLDPRGVPLNEAIEFDLAGDDAGLFSIIAVRAQGVVPEATSETNAPSEQAAAAITVNGTIDAIDESARIATITHGPMVEIGMPGMTMDFEILETVDPSTLAIGEEAILTFERPDGLSMVLASAEPDTPPIEVSGVINSIDAAQRTANISHGPMVEIGMPGMTMDFPIADEIDLADIPLSNDVQLILRRNPDLSMTLIDVVHSAGATQ